ncbi:hypothetical protein IMG5_071820 [Ichthyophthirius multifiliis]|uniref:Casein kinase I n=1 Tax=Ichthyophthirius multifiliis TaxID=5932 RepID=G0QPW1_ICHMU|nr:hypothetical protein IMG5_071820 [Ichthyophthirius multifiliis]EGR32739.1 hypothetical protein IMG5_071820 [Ichthyophthirius multifiliis]|eukprot:XP_004036725.1 hypothetical protein IMG5_071820 [Ichthyophthirius multifiliis]
MEVAIKLEPVNTKHPQLFYEVKIYQYLLQDEQILDKGIPQVYFCSTQGDYNIMVMDLLGPSLEDLLQFCNRQFTLKTVLMIAQQLIQLLEYIHQRHFIHRDIKPNNFLIGAGKKFSKFFIIDFGLAKRYLQRDGTHIPYKDNRNLTGTARYASINTHLGIEQARRDDMEALGYVLIYCLRGQLPWQNLKADNKKDKYEKMMEKKLSTPVEVLCKGFPDEFVKYLAYCRNIRFDEKPDYNYCLSLFKERFQKEGFENDNDFDWIALAKERKKQGLCQDNSIKQNKELII